MSDVIITIDRLSKRYQIGARQAASGMLRERLTEAARGLAGRFGRVLRGQGAGPAGEDFWALRDVSFEVKRGEVVGIIGRNGAGKSTLLKILSRITEPTSGRAVMRGRVGSLLEVGTGFHGELSGRDNIYLSGAILGMKKVEIDRKFDEIVAFSGVEKFLDTPIKRYSSGMNVRLGFAVAAHLDPEILLVDEVLAVGDAEFQKKCLGKMAEVADAGRTVLFVSHNMGAVARLCERGLWLERGSISLEGPASHVVDEYLSVGRTGDAEKRWLSSDAPGDRSVKLLSARVCQGGGVTSVMDITKPLEIEIETETHTAMPEFSLWLRVVTRDGEVAVSTGSLAADGGTGLWPVGRRVTVFTLPAYAFNVGAYSLTVGGGPPYKSLSFLVEGVLSFQVEPTCRKMGRFHAGAWRGVMGPGIASMRTRDIGVM